MSWNANFEKNPYPDGAFVFLNNGENFDFLTTVDWLSAPEADLQFFASFSESTAPIPEPGSLALLSLSAVSVYVSRRRKQQRT
jgi:hypothetical protein